MATYYPTFSYQRDNLSTTYLGDQKPDSYLGSSSLPGNSMYLNQASSAGAFSEILSGSSLSLQNCVQIPSIGGRNEMSFIPPSNDTVSLQAVDGQLNITTSNSLCNPVAGDPPVIPRSVLDGEQSSQSQGLSLSLGSRISSGVSIPPFHYQYQGYSSFFSGHLPFSGKGTIPCTGDESKKSKELKFSDGVQCGFPGGNNDAFETDALSNPQGSISHKQMHSDTYQFESGFANTISSSKYLRVAQELLDEVINIRKALKQRDLDKNISSQPKSSNGMSSEPSESVNNSSSEISPAERQDLQNKKTKLLSMLDEVDRRYRQYYHQMKIVVSSFDFVAGSGAAKPYTALALQTISRHFRCLHDAISGQIQLIQRSLGEQENSSNNQGGAIPRLRYVDHQLRQQRALQQLGVMRNAWRPQRGLPESSVSILRAWLFEHFLHPYPKDSEKIMLAKQTGLTRNQVANWFINARVRLWKPMIEEMYKEEFGEMDSNFKSSLENAAKATRENSSASEDRGEELQESMTSKVADADNVQPGQIQLLKPDHVTDVELNRPIARSMFQNNAIGDTRSPAGMKLQVDNRSNMESHNPYPDTVIPSSQHGRGTLVAGDAMYDLTELSGFTVGGQVSLALGLRHDENNNVFPISGETTMRGNSKVASSVGPETVDFHCMDPGNQQDRFGNPHIFHDFVV
ncbi:BEL1-like homeodomain protein 3 [Herrania umbratica]|uniref:BEL1-like homeodomain protein 3 n=1 Tax=Herrania umbratica TaxID=108875 RepID=A0A6J1ADY1_9ROSI|nr:BEL1-like homeodomain protein 3 [Herrania umbratica]